MSATPEVSTEFYDEGYFLGTSGQRGDFSLLDLGPKFYDRTNTVVEYFDLGNMSSGTVVEAGCGTAPFYRVMQKHNFEHIDVVACDVTASGVNLLNANERPPFQEAKAEALPFSRASLQGIVEWDVLEHIQRPDKAITEAHRILQPGGFFHIVCPNPDSWLRHETDSEKDPYRRDKSHVFPPIVTVDYLDTQLRNIGFEFEIYTRGFQGSEGQNQMGLAAMKLAQNDQSGTHIVVFAQKPAPIRQFCTARPIIK